MSWAANLQLGDVVCRVGSSRRMMVVDFDVDMAIITTSWIPAFGALPTEASYMRAALIRVTVAGQGRSPLG